MQMQKQTKRGKIKQILLNVLKGLVYWKVPEAPLLCTGGSSVPCVLDRSKIFKTTFSLVDSEIICNIYISISWVW